jgi:hypothetical protein
MAKVGKISSKMFDEKKTNQGIGKHTKWKRMGSPVIGGGKVAKGYRKKYRGQGR